MTGGSQTFDLGATALNSVLTRKNSGDSAEAWIRKLSTQSSPFADGIVATAAGRTATHWVPDVTLQPSTTYYWK